MNLKNIYFMSEHLVTKYKINSLNVKTPSKYDVIIKLH